MYQQRLDALIADIEREGLVLNVHYVPEGRSVNGAMHVGAIWPVEQWKQFYERGDRERLIGDEEKLAAIRERDAIARRFDTVSAVLDELRGLLNKPAPGVKGPDHG